MNRRVAIVLVVAAVAVAIENFILLRPDSPSGPPAEADADPNAEPTEAAASGVIAAVCADTLRGYLAALPHPERARSAFLTRAEAEALSSTGLATDAGGPRPLVLEGTLVNLERSVAWLDGIAAIVGSWVGDHELIRIEPRFVVLRKGEEELHIELRQPAREEFQP
jgi:hypothetical protein